MRKQPILAAILLAAAFFACKSVQKTPAHFEAVSKYVYAYSSGSISAKEAIKIRFISPAVGTEQVGQTVAGGVFSLSPSVAGSAKWADAQTLVFTPDAPFERGKKFTARLELGKIFKDVPKEATAFEWEFSARQLDFEVLVDGLRAEDDQDLTRQQIIGRVRTADGADASILEKVLAANQGGNSLKINWLHTPDGLIHDFTVMDVRRGNAASSVEISWDGQPLGVSKKDKMAVEIPALGDFKVLGVRVLNDLEEICGRRPFFGPDHEQSQSLEGLITRWRAGMASSGSSSTGIL